MRRRMSTYDRKTAAFQGWTRSELRLRATVRELSAKTIQPQQSDTKYHHPNTRSRPPGNSLQRSPTNSTWKNLLTNIDPPWIIRASSSACSFAPPERTCVSVRTCPLKGDLNPPWDRKSLKLQLSLRSHSQVTPGCLGGWLRISQISRPDCCLIFWIRIKRGDQSFQDPLEISSPSSARPRHDALGSGPQVHQSGTDNTRAPLPRSSRARPSRPGKGSVLIRATGLGSAVKIPDLKSAPPRFNQKLSAGLPLRRGNKLPPRILKRLKRWARADPSRVPALTCSLRECPSVSSSCPSCTSGSSSPCGVTALGGSTLPSHVFWPSFSENQVGDSKFEVCLLPLDGLPHSATAKNF